MTRSAEAGPGVRHSLGELLVIMKIRRQAEKLRTRRTILKPRGSASPQIVQRGFERLPCKKSRCPGPDAGRHRIGRSRRSRAALIKRSTGRGSRNSRILPASLSVSWIISFRSPCDGVCAPSLHCLNTSPAQGRTVQPLHDVAAFVLVVERAPRGQRCQLPGVLQLFLDLAWRRPAARRRRRTRLINAASNADAAEARNQAAKNIPWKLGRVNQRKRILDVRANRIQGRSDFHDRFRPASDTQNRALDIKSANGFRQPFIVSEDDHLARTRSILQRPRNPSIARRIHRLNRVVDHDKAKGTGRKCGPGQKQAQRERVQLALTHDAKGSAGNAIDSDVKRDTPLALCAGKLDPSKLDVAVLTQMLPRCHRLIGDRRETLDFGFRRMRPSASSRQP